MSDRFDCSIKRGHQTMLANVVGRMQAGQVFVPTAQELKDLGDLAGQLNKCSAPPSLPVQIAPDYAMNGAPYVCSTYSDAIVAIPARVPVNAVNGETCMVSLAEYQWGGTRHHYMNLSRQAGDMTVQSSGLQVTIYFEVGKEFGPGDLFYTNVWHTKDDPAPCGARFSAQLFHA